GTGQPTALCGYGCTPQTHEGRVGQSECRWPQVQRAEPTPLFEAIATRATPSQLRRNLLITHPGGGGGIRTHGALARPTGFKTAPFARSGTPPCVYSSGFAPSLTSSTCC